MLHPEGAPLPDIVAPEIYTGKKLDYIPGFLALLLMMKQLPYRGILYMKFTIQSTAKKHGQQFLKINNSLPLLAPRF